MILLMACAARPDYSESSIPQGIPLAELASPTYKLAPGDEIEIRFSNRADLNETTHVRPDGYINLEQIGALRAYNLTPDELSAVIATAYKSLSAKTETPSNSQFLLAIGDELVIRLPFHEGMDQTVKIRPDGKISLALAGIAQAQGLTTEALEAALNHLYEKHLRKPTVSVSVANYSTARVQIGAGVSLVAVENLAPTVRIRTAVPRQIFIGGEVRQPGAHNYRYGLTALQAILEAGGLNKESSGANAAILRRTTEGLKIIAINASTLKSVHVSAPHEVMLEPFDIVVVPKTALAAAADAVDAVFNLVPFLRNSSMSVIYELDKTRTDNSVRVNP